MRGRDWRAGWPAQWPRIAPPNSDSGFRFATGDPNQSLGTDAIWATGPASPLASRAHYTGSIHRCQMRDCSSRCLSKGSSQTLARFGRFFHRPCAGARAPAWNGICPTCRPPFLIPPVMVSSAAAGWGITDLTQAPQHPSLNVIILFETFETQCMCACSNLRACCRRGG